MDHRWRRTSFCRDDLYEVAVEGHDRELFPYGESEDLPIGGQRHPELAHMPGIQTHRPEVLSGPAWQAHIEQKSNQAADALNGMTRSVRRAAAKARAWRMSSGSSSG